MFHVSIPTPALPRKRHPPDVRDDRAAIGQRAGRVDRRAGRLPAYRCDNLRDEMARRALRLGPGRRAFVRRRRSAAVREAANFRMTVSPTAPMISAACSPSVSSAWRRSASQKLPRSSRRYGSRRCEPTNPHRAAARTDRALCTMHQPRHLRCRQQRCVSLYRPSQCDTSVRKCPAVQREWRCPIERSPHHSASPDSRLLH